MHPLGVIRWPSQPRVSPRAGGPGVHVTVAAMRVAPDTRTRRPGVGDTGGPPPGGIMVMHSLAVVLPAVCDAQTSARAVPGLATQAAAVAAATASTAMEHWRRVGDPPSR